MDPELRLLVSFLAVAEELNFTRAAERLHIAQPALSAQVRQLEGQLGVQLLERTTRSVRLTPAGEAVVARAGDALAAYRGVWDAARRAAAGEVGRLRLGYSHGAGYETAPALVAASRATHPDVAVDAEVMDTPAVLTGVADGRLDAGLVRSAASADGVRLRVIRWERQGVLAHASHPLAGRSEVAVAEVAAHPLLLHPRAANPGHYDAVAALFAAAGATPRIVARPVAFDPSQAIVREGEVVVLVGESLRSSLGVELRWVPLAEPQARLAVQLAVRAADPPEIAEAFARLALDHAARAGWLDGAPEAI